MPKRSNLDATDRTYHVRFVNKRLTQAGDHTYACIPANAFADRKMLARALREADVLPSGTRLREMRVEGDKVVVFPQGTIWHSVILTVLDVEEPKCLRVAKIECATPADYRWMREQATANPQVAGARLGLLGEFYVVDEERFAHLKQAAGATEFV